MPALGDQVSDAVKFVRLDKSQGAKSMMPGGLREFFNAGVGNAEAVLGIGTNKVGFLRTTPSHSLHGVVVGRRRVDEVEAAKRLAASLSPLALQRRPCAMVECVCR